MKGKAILITGASSGMGEAIATLFCQKGSYVIGVARNQEKMAAMAEKLGENFIHYAADLSKPENVQKVFEWCKNRGLKLDGAVHCAGITLK